jgi:DNA-binding transcriptional MerR regulator
MSNNKRITTGTLAKEFHVSANSIKNWSDEWEKNGTLPKVPRTPGGHRIYGPEHAAVFKQKLSLQPNPASPMNSGEAAVG